MMIRAGVVYGDAARPRPVPEGAYEGGLIALLRRVGVKLGGSGVLLLDSVSAAAVGLPTGTLPEGPAAKDHPAAVEARAAGFKVREVHRWSRFTLADRTINVGLLEFIDADKSPMWRNLDTLPTDTTAGLAAWHFLTGYPYIGDPGDAANEIVRGVLTKPGRKPPTWHPSGAAWPKGAEGPYLVGHWSRTEPTRYEHGYDRWQAYLSAMTVAKVAAGPLRHTRTLEFDPTLGGWWYADFAPWQGWLAEVMPDPAGYGEQGPRWVTTPTLELLAQLYDAGEHGGFQVLDSWTATGEKARELLKPVATRLRDTWTAAEAIDPADRATVQATVKAAYHKLHSKWATDYGDIQRRDWGATVAQTHRANTWRAMRRAGEAGRWPLRIDTDMVWYGSDNPDPYADAPAGFRVVKPGDMGSLGMWRVKGFIDKEATA